MNPKTQPNHITQWIETMWDAVWRTFRPAFPVPGCTIRPLPPLTPAERDRIRQAVQRYVNRPIRSEVQQEVSYDNTNTRHTSHAGGCGRCAEEHRYSRPGDPHRTSPSACPTAPPIRTRRPGRIRCDSCSGRSFPNRTSSYQHSKHLRDAGRIGGPASADYHPTHRCSACPCVSHQT
jgi:hypothetical protein